jgi:hypothetical protein
LKRHQPILLALLLAGATLGAARTPAAAQLPNDPNASHGIADTGIFSTHTYLNMIVGISVHGNIMRFESPIGREHIRNGTFTEGYLISNFDPSEAIHGYDIGFTEAGFGGAIINQPNGPNRLPLTITRTTTNGRFRLTQKYAFDKAENECLITMTVRNNGPGIIRNVWLERMCDFDIEQNVTGSFVNNFSRTRDAVSADNTGGSGMLLQALSTNGHVTIVDNSIEATTFGSGIASPDSLDGVARVVYFLGDIAAGKSKTVIFGYRRY